MVGGFGLSSKGRTGAFEALNWSSSLYDPANHQSFGIGVKDRSNLHSCGWSNEPSKIYLSHRF